MLTNCSFVFRTSKKMARLASGFLGVKGMIGQASRGWCGINWMDGILSTVRTEQDNLSINMSTRVPLVYNRVEGKRLIPLQRLFETWTR